MPTEVWQQRLDQGKIITAEGWPINAQTAYRPGLKIHYFREQQGKEPTIPFTECILFQNEEILVACKPHFLPVIAGGPYINECLLGRLQARTGNFDLAPIHRIDRETAGLVMFSAKKMNRGLYHDLFLHGKVEKTYQALCHYRQTQSQRHWLVENKIVRGSPWFRMETAPGASNSRSLISLVAAKGDIAHFRLQPITGKKHQLRLHLSGLGYAIVNDRYYPALQPETDDDFTKPLQLIAQGLRFDDPISGERMEFQSGRKLLW